MAKLLSLRSLRNAFLLRAILVWVAVRVALAFGGAADPALGTELLVVLLVPGIVVLNARRRAEDILLGNLGISSWSLAFLALPVVTLLEVLVP